MYSSNPILKNINTQFTILEWFYKNTNPEMWKFQNDKSKAAWQLTYHILETIEFYLSGKAPHEFDWGGGLKVSWEEKDFTKAPSIDQMMIYHKKIKNLSEQKLNDKLYEKILLSNEYLNMLIYLIRHTEYHIGELNQILRSTGNEVFKWS